MNFFNANAMIGPHFAPRSGMFDDADSLLAEMDEYDIEKSLVYHGLAQEYEFNIGNQRILEEVAGKDRLIPCWVGGLCGLDSAPEPERFVEDALANGVKAVRLFFDGLLSDSSSVAATLYDPLLAELARRRIPTFIHFERDATVTTEDLQVMAPIMEKHPDLPVIFTFLRAEAKTLNVALLMMKNHANLYLETIGTQMNKFLERVVEERREDRLLFSVAFPWANSAVTRIALAYADVPDSAKAAVAAGNLNRLIEGIQL